jgi:hypothetical protein
MKMAKITIDETELDTDTFNEEQTKIFQEISLLSSELARQDYMLRLTDDRRKFLASELLKLSQEDTQEVEEAKVVSN